MDLSSTRGSGVLRILFVFIYSIAGLIILYQASKIASFEVGKRLTGSNLDTRIASTPEDTTSKTLKKGIDESIVFTPLFSPGTSEKKEKKQEVVEESTNPLLGRFILEGVILMGKENSIAIIKKPGERKSGIYKLGSEIDGYTLTDIQFDKIILSDENKSYSIPLYFRKTAKRSPRQPQRRLETFQEEVKPARQIKRILSRSDVETKLFQRVNEILSQVAISPYLVNGKMEGIRLVRVPRNNIVYELGGRSGDIIRRVNGHELTQIDQMYKLWENIKDDRFITVDIQRNNQLITYNFEIRE